MMVFHRKFCELSVYFRQSGRNQAWSVGVLTAMRGQVWDKTLVLLRCHKNIEMWVSQNSCFFLSGMYKMGQLLARICLSMATSNILN